MGLNTTTAANPTTRTSPRSSSQPVSIHALQPSTSSPPIHMPTSVEADPTYCSSTNSTPCDSMPHSICCVCSPTFYPVGTCCPPKLCVTHVTIAGPVNVCNDTNNPAGEAQQLQDAVDVVLKHKWSHEEEQVT